MGKYDEYITSSNNETYEFVLIPRVKNSAYEYNKDNVITFKGRPANTQEKSKYRLQLGVNTTADSVYIYTSNLPDNIKPGDKIKFMGATQTIESIGYYYDATGIVNASLYDPEYIIARCGKGITLNKG